MKLAILAFFLLVTFCNADDETRNKRHVMRPGPHLGLRGPIPGPFPAPRRIGYGRVPGRFNIPRGLIHPRPRRSIMPNENINNEMPKIETEMPNQNEKRHIFAPALGMYGPVMMRPTGLMRPFGMMRPFGFPSVVLRKKRDTNMEPTPTETERPTEKRGIFMPGLGMMGGPMFLPGTMMMPGPRVMMPGLGPSIILRKRDTTSTDKVEEQITGETSNNVNTPNIFSKRHIIMPGVMPGYGMGFGLPGFIPRPFFGPRVLPGIIM